MTKILLVEDNEMNRDMLSRRLERKGYEVVMAVDGEQAVAMAGTETPDLILMDMSLPVLDGWEATRRSRQRRRNANDPGDRAHRARHGRRPRKALEAGCDDYDTKPIELPRLLGKDRSAAQPQRLRLRAVPPMYQICEIGNLKHDLRTPLNHIIGYCEMLLEEAPARPAADFVADLERIHLAGRRLLTVINDLFDPVKSGRLQRRSRAGSS